MRLYSYVHSGDQIMLGSIVTFLEGIKCYMAIYCNVPGRNQML